MPLKDRDRYREYMNAWYKRPENRARTVARVTRRKIEDYYGLCVNCGAKTWGSSKTKRGSAWCKNCAVAQRTAGTVPAFLLQETLRLASENLRLDDLRHVAVSHLHEAERRVKELEAQVQKLERQVEDEQARVAEKTR